MAGAQNKTISALNITEEVFNSSIHALGALAGIVGLVLGLLTLSAPASFTASFVIYAVCLVLLMTMSTMYHALTFSRANKVFRILDHSGIFLLIAGSFTPFIVVLYSGWLQIVLLAVVWSLAAAGIALRASLPKAMSRFGVGIYIAMGWMGLVFVPKLSELPGQAIWLLAIGGVLYTIGAALLIIKKPFIHVAWHVFVVAAAATHFFAITSLA